MPMQRQAIPLLLLVTAPSGAGKTTVARNLLASTPSLQRVVTCTTRRPRGGERDGVDYHFLAPAEFERRRIAGEFLEYAEVYGNWYGTLKREVVDRLEAGSDVLLCTDVQGAAAIQEMSAQDPLLSKALVSVFIMPPSLAELERRLRTRAEDAADVIARRLSVAQHEITRWRSCDFVVVSASMGEDLAAVQGILAAEKLRVTRVRELKGP